MESLFWASYTAKSPTTMNGGIGPSGVLGAKVANGSKVRAAAVDACCSELLERAHFDLCCGRLELAQCTVT